MIPGIVASVLDTGGAAGAIGDPFFDDVVASLHFDGTDGSTTFTDVMGHTFTAVNNAQIDTAQSRFGGAALLLDGTNDYITAPDSADWDLGVGDFTVECWVRFNGDPGTAEMTFVAQYDTTGNQRGWVFGLNNNTLRFLYSTNGSSDATALTAAWNPATAIWYHVRVVRFKADVFFFVDGQLLGSSSIGASTTIFNSSAVLQIGAHSLGASGDMNGWIDDLRITRAARSTKTFSRGVRANYDNLGLPGDERYALAQSILHLDTDFSDNKSVTWTPAGNAFIDSAQKPFGPASARLDGTGDWIDATDSDFAWGTGDFTIECWVRFNTTSGNNFAFTFGGGWGPYRLSSNGTWGVFDGSASNPITSSSTPTTGIWYHVAVCRRGTTMRLFINGTSVGSATNSTNFSGTSIRIGAQPAGTGTLDGWVQGFRATAFARYVGDFQPPLRNHPVSFGDPHFDDVISLIHWDGTNGSTTYVDQRADLGRTWTNGANGGSLDTANPKYGASAVKFTGTSNNQINSDGGADWGFGAEDFTIEFWLYVPALQDPQMYWDQRGSGNAAVCLFRQGGSLLYFINSGVQITASAAITAAVWQHVAISRNRLNTRLFVNGIQVGSTWTNDTTTYVVSRARLGTNGDTGGGFGTITGSFDDIRVTRGTGRYQSNFSPPPIAFADAA